MKKIFFLGIVTLFISNSFAQNRYIKKDTIYKTDGLTKFVDSLERTLITGQKNIISHLKNQELKIDTLLEQSLYINTNIETIHAIDKYIESEDKNKNSTKQSFSGSIKETVIQDLIPALYDSENHDSKRFKEGLQFIFNTSTITWLEYVYSDEYKSMINQINENGTFTPKDQYPKSITQLKNDLNEINKRVNEIFEANLSNFQFTELSKKRIKFIYANHGNDVFSVPFYNDDRDLTGAFRIEIGTDYLKMRLLNKDNDKFFDGRNWYSFQSIFAGGEGYTPYLRDTSIFKDNFSIDSLDRPYASFQYFGRAKYRLSRKEKHFLRTQVKLGTIGKNKGQDIQSIIHRDITVGTRTPFGWGSQIAAGGRIAFSLEAYYEMNLNFFEQQKKSLCKPYTNMVLEGKVGHDMTAIALGLNFSNKSLGKRGGVNIDTHKGYGSEIDKTRWLFNINSKVRYVQHNSMLEGYGVFRHAIDEDPNTPTDAHVLNSSQINRFVWVTNMTASINFKQIAILFNQRFASPEFESEHSNSKKWNRIKWSHVGTVGLAFKID